jgi:hypothetical protein
MQENEQSVVHRGIPSTCFATGDEKPIALGLVAAPQIPIHSTTGMRAFRVTLSTHSRKHSVRHGDTHEADFQFV